MTRELVPDSAGEIVTAMPCEEFLSRLKQTVGPARGVSLFTGDGRKSGFVAEFPTNRTFRVRKAGVGPALYVLHLHGRLVDSTPGCSISIKFEQHPVGRVVIWSQWVLVVVLAAFALIAALRQPIFLAFAGFVLFGGAALLWNERARGSRSDLRALIIDVARTDATRQQDVPKAHR
jgi:hypothetical protein